jgi:hypothetical protein
MKGKKENKGNGTAADGKAKPDGEEGEKFGQIANKADLKAFLNGLRDKMTEQAAAPIYVLTAMNHILTLEQIYEWLDNENKEIARDIWLRLRQAGLQLRNPPLLFNADEEDLVTPGA